MENVDVIDQQIHDTERDGVAQERRHVENGGSRLRPM